MMYIELLYIVMHFDLWPHLSLFTLDMFANTTITITIAHS